MERMNKKEISEASLKMLLRVGMLHILKESLQLGTCLGLETVSLLRAAQASGCSALTAQ